MKIELEKSKIINLTKGDSLENVLGALKEFDISKNKKQNTKVIKFKNFQFYFLQNKLEFILIDLRFEVYYKIYFFKNLITKYVTFEKIKEICTNNKIEFVERKIDTFQLNIETSNIQFIFDLSNSSIEKIVWGFDNQT